MFRSSTLLGSVLRGLSLVALASGCKKERVEVHPLWPAGAPGSEARRHEPELARDWWVANVHHPSLTVFEPKPRARTGAAVVILPGGGHQRLVFEPEGVEPARFLAERGMTAFVLKYRLAREKASNYSLAEHGRMDCLRAMRWVRAHSAEYQLDAGRIGIMGWSAGAELAAFASYGEGEGDRGASDPIELESARPNFQVLIYPGPLAVPERLPKDAPQTFLLAASDDTEVASTVQRLLELYQRAELPVEVHLFAKGGHAFNMGQRSDVLGIRGWPRRLSEWLEASGL